MLELINVKKIYKTSAGDVAALDDISIRFPETGMVFVTGKSGSGKTTLLNVIGGLDGIDSGEIEVYGKKFSEFTPSEYDSYRNTLIGFIFQEYNLLPDYNIEKNVGIANELQGVEIQSEKVKEILNSVDIDSYEGRNPSQLSGGQKQRVAIARALIKNPKIIMADEPTGALDSVTGVQVVEELKRLSKEKLVIVISHDLELANKYADRIIRLVDGKVVEDFSVEEVEVKENVFQDGNVLTVKKGSDLSSDETKVLADAIKNRKAIKFTDSVKVKKKKPTDSSKIKSSGEKIELIKSKMKFTSAAMLGIKSLKVKPLRLIFTILLSAVAFAVFGVFDTIASYDRAGVISDLLRRGEYSSIALSGEYVAESGHSMHVNLNDNVISELKGNAGVNFKSVYSAKTLLSEELSRPGTIVYGTNNISNIENKTVAVKPKGKGYYYPQVNGIIEFGPSEVNEFGEIEKYGLNPIGNSVFPKFNANENYIEVAISEYLANSLLYNLGEGSPFFGNDKRIYTIEDFVGIEFKISGINMSSSSPVLKIVGVYHCGDIPAEYDILKDKYVANKNERYQPQIDALRSILASGAHNLLMVAEGEMQRALNRFKKPVAFYDEPATYSIDDTIDDKYILYSDYVRDYFFTKDTIPAENVVMFDTLGKEIDETAPRSYELQDNEVLIHASDFRNLFQLELNDTDTRSGTLREYVYKVYQVYDQEKEEELRTALEVSFNIANELLKKSYPELFNGTDKFRNIRLIRTLSSNNVTNQVNLKVVGVYYGMQNRNPAERTYFPFVSNTQTLKNIGVYTEQGNYTYALGFFNSKMNSGSSKYIASKLTSGSGLGFNWYGNKTLDVLAVNEQMILQFTDLFLYAALVLALFSIFMLFNYISTSIVSKRQSIGVLRALGSNSGDVFKMFITESVIISVINGILASIIAFVACILVNSYIRDLMKLGINFALFGFRQVIIIFLISIFTGIASSIIPIIKIAREKPVDLIRRP